jgi:hypothetical protein
VRAELKCEAVEPPTQAVNLVIEKFCCRCKTTKPLSDFGVDRRRKLGVYPTCKSCLRKMPRSPQANTNSRRYRERLKARSEVSCPVDKWCSPCKKIKLKSEFSKDAAEPSGLKRTCKTCRAADNLKRSSRIGLVVHQKVCSVCRQNLPASSFSTRSDSIDKLCGRCRKCERQRFAPWYVENQDRVIESAARWAAENPLKSRSGVAAAKANRRAREKEAGTITAAEWREKLEYFNFSCAYCLRHESVAGVMSVEHMLPLSRGGTNTADNIVPACLRCNLNKSSRTVLEFLVWREIVPHRFAA